MSEAEQQYMETSENGHEAAEGDADTKQSAGLVGQNGSEGEQINASKAEEDAGCVPDISPSINQAAWASQEPQMADKHMATHEPPNLVTRKGLCDNCNDRDIKGVIHYRQPPLKQERFYARLPCWRCSNDIGPQISWAPRRL